MGLDVYVGSFTRYICHDWQTVLQSAGAVVLRADDQESADPDTVRELVLDWRRRLNTAMPDGGHLDWDESAWSPYYTDKPGWDAFGSLLMWAAYSEHPRLKRPTQFVGHWEADTAYQTSNGKGWKNPFPTRYPNLLKGCEWWLPGRLPGVLQLPDMAQNPRIVGSSRDLLQELDELNERTWQADGETVAAWAQEAAPPEGAMEEGARFCFALLRSLVGNAVAGRLPMMLDY